MTWTQILFLLLVANCLGYLIYVNTWNMNHSVINRYWHLWINVSTIKLVISKEKGWSTEIKSPQAPFEEWTREFWFLKSRVLNPGKGRIDTSITQVINGMFESLLGIKKDRKPEKLKGNWPEWYTYYQGLFSQHFISHKKYKNKPNWPACLQIFVKKNI